MTPKRDGPTADCLQCRSDEGACTCTAYCGAVVCMAFDDEHLEPAGPWEWRRITNRIPIEYRPPAAGPVNVTVNTGSLPFWQHNPANTEGTP